MTCNSITISPVTYMYGKFLFHLKNKQKMGPIIWLFLISVLLTVSSGFNLTFEKWFVSFSMKITAKVILNVAHHGWMAKNFFAIWVCHMKCFQNTICTISWRQSKFNMSRFKLNQFDLKHEILIRCLLNTEI